MRGRVVLIVAGVILALFAFSNPAGAGQFVNETLDSTMVFIEAVFQ